jgi:hypothetical protein
MVADSQLFTHGIFAHAPARHVWQVGGKWSRLTGTAAMADGHDGTVVFSIQADGKEIWHSKRVKPAQLETFDIPLTGAQELELRVNGLGDGNRSAWALWLEPTLIR